MSKNIEYVSKLNTNFMTTIMTEPNVMVLQKLLKYLLKTNNSLLKDITSSKDLSIPFKDRLELFNKNAIQLVERNIKVKSKESKSKKFYVGRGARGGAMGIVDPITQFTPKQLSKFTPEQLLKLAALNIEQIKNERKHERKMTKMNRKSAKNNKNRRNRYIGNLTNSAINIGKLTLPFVLSGFMVQLISDTVTEVTEAAAEATSKMVGAPIGAMLEGLSHFYTGVNNMASRTCRIGTWTGYSNANCLDMIEYSDVSTITTETIDKIRYSFGNTLNTMDNTKSVLLAKVSLFVAILVMVYMLVFVLRILLFSTEISVFGSVKFNAKSTRSPRSPRRPSRRSIRSPLKQLTLKKTK